MNRNRPIAIIALLALSLAAAGDQALAQQPASQSNHANGSARSSAELQVSKLLAQARPMRRPFFSLMSEIRNPNLSGPTSSIMAAASVANLQVFGNGTLGKLTKWTGFTSTNSAIGDSNIYEDKFGKVGIGTTAPTSVLTVQGMIETTLGGIKFPDGTLQTTSTAGALFGVVHDATLQGNGTLASALGVAVPLSLSSSLVNPVFSVLNGGNGAGVSSFSTGGNGVRGASTNGAGVFGDSSNGFGVGGFSTSSIGVNGISSDSIGVNGEGNPGVRGRGNDSTSLFGGTGVDAFGGTSLRGFAGHGVNAVGGLGYFGGDGVRAQAGDGLNGGGDGVSASGGNGTTDSNGGGGSGVVASGGNSSGVGNHGGDGVVGVIGLGINGAADGRAGLFLGDVYVRGNLTKTMGTFKIDHPLDPENKYLNHSFVESPDMMNIYNGNITTDENGDAIVEMPDYFDALNKDFRYQLTVIGTFAQAIIASEMKDNRFAIKTNAAGVKVSWMVTGVRHDAYADKHRVQVEEVKAEKERGHYLHPEVFNQPEEKSIEWALRPEMMQRLKQQSLDAEARIRKQQR